MDLRLYHSYYKMTPQQNFNSCIAGFNRNLNCYCLVKSLLACMSLISTKMLCDSNSTHNIKLLFNAMLQVVDFKRNIIGVIKFKYRYIVGCNLKLFIASKYVLNSSAQILSIQCIRYHLISTVLFGYALIRTNPIFHI